METLFDEIYLIISDANYESGLTNISKSARDICTYIKAIPIEDFLRMNAETSLPKGYETIINYLDGSGGRLTIHLLKT